MFYCFIDPEQISGDHIHITEGNFHHLKNVLHTVPGERIRVRSDRYVYECEIEQMGRDKIRARILSSQEAVPEWSHKFIAAPALLQEKRFDLMLQYAVQLGVSEIHPVITRNTVTRELKSERTERWRRIVHAACMQSQRNFIPMVEEPAELETCVRRIMTRDRITTFAAYELEENRKIADLVFSNSHSIAFFTGPEGGFTVEEAKMMESAGIQTITLGHNILRAETAVLVTLTLLQQKLGYL